MNRGLLSSGLATVAYDAHTKVLVNEVHKWAVDVVAEVFHSVQVVLLRELTHSVNLFRERVESGNKLTGLVDLQLRFV